MAIKFFTKFFIFIEFIILFQLSFGNKRHIEMHGNKREVLPETAVINYLFVEI